MKVTYTKNLARKILLAFLSFIIILSVAAFFVRNAITKKLENISKLAGNIERDQSRPEEALLLLHQAEDDFQSSLLNSGNGKNTGYKIKLQQAFNEIDTLLKTTTDTANLTIAQNGQVRFWYKKKLILSDRLSVLKHSFDSLLTVYADFNNKAAKLQAPGIDTHNLKKNTSSNTDTVKKVIPGEKKGLFKRLKEAIANKNGASKNVVEINHNNKMHEADLTQKSLAENKTAYTNQLKQLQQRNMKLLGMQKELIALNTHITNELEYIITEVNAINYKMADEFKGIAFKNYQETTQLLNNLYLTALFLVLVFAALLIVFIIQLNKSEMLLLKENERSISMAQQKTDLLLHMSHEVRNPLTAIKGFLYIFSQTSLSKRQTEMLDSIRLSSDMLLRTLNDTLDAAKMETSEFKIHNDPFSPDYTLKMVVESMEFSATKKRLAMNYDFKGDKNAIMLGDSFRLKQIMVNLLSNAIKYTKSGSVTVNAELRENEDKLYVEVSDTGAGISAEQQANLFSKYYQTSSSKGKLGTGLGLYICKQLVELQGGKITVKSKPDEGTTFSFFIPYEKNGNGSSENQEIDDPLSLLNGLNILTVDDNELNLMFLKVMMNKWNVKFHQALNGKEALDIISKHDIKMVLTDIQMPEMDGYELLAAIRKLNKPLNRLPVIAFSSATEPAEEKKIMKMGFAGIVSKPFVETELIDQLVKALK